MLPVTCPSHYKCRARHVVALFPKLISRSKTLLGTCTQSYTWQSLSPHLSVRLFRDNYVLEFEFDVGVLSRQSNVHRPLKIRVVYTHPPTNTIQSNRGVSSNKLSDWPEACIVELAGSRLTGLFALAAAFARVLCTCRA